ncbi:MAG: 3-hydroxyacyl-ACP dehydratase FabZ family protein [Gemmatimonadaceae bacterium]
MRHYHLDRVVKIEPGKGATGVRVVALSDDVYNEHFPGNPVLPGVYLLEGLAQTAGVLLWESCNHSRIAVMVSIDRARFPSFARPGDSVSLAVEIESYDDRAARVRGVASVESRQVAVAAFTFSMQEPDVVIPPLYRAHWEHAADIWLGRYPGSANATSNG